MGAQRKKKWKRRKEARPSSPPRTRPDSCANYLSLPFWPDTPEAVQPSEEAKKSALARTSILLQADFVRALQFCQTRSSISTHGPPSVRPPVFGSAPSFSPIGRRKWRRRRRKGGRREAFQFVAAQEMEEGEGVEAKE